MLASRATRLDRDEDFALSQVGVAGDGLLILRPEPRGDSFLDVGQCLLFVFPLRYTSRQSRAFGHNPAVFRVRECYMEDHAHMLPSVTPVLQRPVRLRYTEPPQTPRAPALRPRTQALTSRVRISEITYPPLQGTERLRRNPRYNLRSRTEEGIS